MRQFFLGKNPPSEGQGQWCQKKNLTNFLLAISDHFLEIFLSFFLDCYPPDHTFILQIKMNDIAILHDANDQGVKI